MPKIILLVAIMFFLSGCAVVKQPVVKKAVKSDIVKVNTTTPTYSVDPAVTMATQVDILKSNVQPEKEKVGLSYRNIVYAKIEGFEDLKLDLYLPSNENKQLLPTIIYIHGGGWRTGAKDNCFAKDQLVDNGYAVACVDYRLSGKAKFPAAILDIKTAVRWLRANATYYNLDINNFGVWGSSAGGHLAVMLGLTGGLEYFESKDGIVGYSSRVQAVVDWYGPVEFSAIITLKDKFKEYYEAAGQFIGQPLENSSELISKASPLSYITADDPPILIMHGAKDAVVPYQQSEILYKALKQKEIKVDYYLSPYNDHEFHEEKDYKMVSDFFDKYLKN